MMVYTKMPLGGTNSVTTTLAIEGMTCGACTSSVEGGFDGVDGVLRFNISLLAERAMITHDPTKLTAEKLVEIIEERGFGASILSTTNDVRGPSNGTSTAQFKIFGNLDATSAAMLEEHLVSRPGINSASLSLSTSRLTVIHVPSVAGLRVIVEAVE